MARLKPRLYKGKRRPYEGLVSWEERQADWRGNGDGLAGWGEGARSGVESEFDDGIGVLIFGEEEIT